MGVEVVECFKIGRRKRLPYKIRIGRRKRLPYKKSHWKVKLLYTASTNISAVHSLVA